MFAIFLNLKMTKNPFTMTLEEYYENCTHEQLVEKILEKNDRIDKAENEITSLEMENKELQKDLEKDARVTALYETIKQKDKQKESILKNHDIARDEWQIKWLEKDSEINKLKKSQCKCVSVQSVK